MVVSACTDMCVGADKKKMGSGRRAVGLGGVLCLAVLIVLLSAAWEVDAKKEVGVTCSKVEALFGR